MTSPASEEGQTARAIMRLAYYGPEAVVYVGLEHDFWPG